MKYTITGATGHLGRLVVQAMLQLVAPNEIRAAVHTPAKAAHLMAQGLEVVTADYLDVSLMKTALVGTDVLIYIPSKTYDLVQRVTELENTLAAMQQAQVKKIIFVSFFADQANNPFRMSAYYGYVPRRLAASEFDYAIVKNALYADPLVPYLPELIQRHNIIYPVGQQPLAFITQQDSAAAIAKLAVQPQLRDHGQTYLLSQTQNYTMPQLAEIMTTVTGEPIGYQPVTLAEFAAIYAAEGDGQELASMYHAGALGLLADVSTDFARITGQQPQGMREFLAANYRIV